jgi:glycosyltransferase involved in cell wall biosynthesis
MSLKRFIPNPAKIALVALYASLRTLMRSRSGSPSPKLNLSGVLPSEDSGSVVHGGKVKLLHLRERFGDSWDDFNLAYFVSSGLPFAAHVYIGVYRLFGIKIAWNQNGVAYPGLYEKSVVYRINQLMEPIHRSDYVIYQAEFVKKCADRFLGSYGGPSSVIYNPVDTDRFSPLRAPLPHAPLKLITTINHSSIERIALTLEAMKILGDEGIEAKLIILGDMKKAGWGSARRDVVETIERLGLKGKVEERGSYLQKDAPGLFREGHIFVHLKYLDPCPTLIIEAMACGLPIVATASGGLPEMVSDRSGVLIPLPEDFEKMHYPSASEVAGAIKKVYADLDSYSIAARKEALHPKFDKRSWLKSHEEIFKSLLR